jgi:hypothetical protein
MAETEADPSRKCIKEQVLEESGEADRCKSVR